MNVETTLCHLGRSFWNEIELGWKWLSVLSFTAGKLILRALFRPWHFLLVLRMLRPSYVWSIKENKFQRTIYLDYWQWYNQNHQSLHKRKMNSSLYILVRWGMTVGWIADSTCHFSSLFHSLWEIEKGQNKMRDWLKTKANTTEDAYRQKN